jgi:hypothetical protein
MLAVLTDSDFMLLLAYIILPCIMEKWATKRLNNYFCFLPVIFRQRKIKRDELQLGTRQQRSFIFHMHTKRLFYIYHRVSN